MKKLICLSDVKSMHADNKTNVYVEAGTIITAAARDYVKANNMVFIDKKEEYKAMESCDISGLSKEDLYKILKVLVDRGLLDQPNKQYVSEKTGCGFKLVRGESAKLEPLFPEKTGDKVKFLELIHEEDSPMQSGYFTIDRSCFDTVTEIFETYCIVEGVLDIKVNGTKFKAVKGDVLNIPKGAHIECSSDVFTKIFYSCGDR